MSIMQLILAGNGLIEPSIAVDGLAFSDTDTRTYTGNGSAVLMSNDTLTVPNNWKTKSWTYTARITSSASYTCIGYSIYLYKNGAMIGSWSTPASNDSYFRYNSGTRTHTSTISLDAGDVVNAKIYITGRNVGGTTPSTTNYHELKRIT